MVGYIVGMKKNGKESQREAWIALTAVKGIGRKTLAFLRKELHRRKISTEEFWNGSAGLWTQFGLKPAQQEALRLFRQTCSPESYKQMLDKRGIEVVLLGDAMYPRLLGEIASPRS